MQKKFLVISETEFIYPNNAFVFSDLQSEKVYYQDFKSLNYLGKVQF